MSPCPQILFAKMNFSGCLLFYSILSYGWPVSFKSFPCCWHLYVFPLVSILNYSVINLGKVQEAKGAHSRCAPLRKATPSQGSSLGNLVIDEYVLSLRGLPNICCLILCALEWTQTPVGWKPSFSRRSEYSLVGINWAPAAFIGIAESRGKPSPGFRRGAGGWGRTQQAHVRHFQLKIESNPSWCPHISVTILKPMELHTLKEWMLWHVNYISI